MIEIPSIKPKKIIKDYSEIKKFSSKFNPEYLNFVSRLIYGKKFVPKKGNSKLSVIYPVFGKLFYGAVQESIKSLLNQTLKDIEIIISEQYVKEKIYESLAKELSIKYISEQVEVIGNIPMFNPGRLRNMGKSIATNFYLYFTDADIIFPNRQTMEKIIGLFDGYTAFCRLRKKGAVKDISKNYSFYKDTDDQFYLEYMPPEKAHGGSIFVSSDIFDFVGGYTEQFFIWGTEDSDLRWKINSLFNLIDLSKIEEISVGHIEHGRPYLSRIAWERNVFLESIRRKSPIFEVIIDDLLSGKSVYIKNIRKKLKWAE